MATDVAARYFEFGRVLDVRPLDAVALRDVAERLRLFTGYNTRGRSSAADCRYAPW